MNLKHKPTHRKRLGVLIAAATCAVAVGAVPVALAAAPDAAVASATAPTGSATSTQARGESSISFRSGTVKIHKDGTDTTFCITSVPRFDVDKDTLTAKATLVSADGRTIDLNLQGDYKVIGMHLYVTGGTMKISDGTTLVISGKTEINVNSVFNVNHLWTASSVPTSGGSVDLDLGQNSVVGLTQVDLANVTPPDSRVTWSLRSGEEVIWPGQSVRKAEKDKAVTLPDFCVYGTLIPDSDDPALTIQETGPVTQVTWGEKTYSVGVGQSVVLFQDDANSVQLKFSRTDGSAGKPNQLTLAPMAGGGLSR